ncbi:MAG: DNA polymerase III PolC-type [Burkholderiaceae bacterium]|nr:DNA polymerase III PolC-type [Burkholderiaceae bacterium]
MPSLWRRWRQPHQATDDTRWVVLDVEASGLDAAHDSLLAIAAIAVHVTAGHACIVLADSFEVVLRQPQAPPDRANILLHGIGVGRQRAGVEPLAALGAFVRFAARSPLVGFHAAFDRTLIERHLGLAGLPTPRNPWLDLAPLAAVLHPGVRAHALDDWMAHFGIRCAQRHQAAADTLATAELLLHLWPRLREQVPRPGIADARKLAAQRRWLAS